MARKTRPPNNFIIPIEHAQAVLYELVQGFSACKSNHLAPLSDESTRQVLQEHAGVVLYRLLFLLYAEARAMLPNEVRNAVVRLRALHEQIHQQKGDTDTAMYSAHAHCMLWEQLRQIGHAIWQQAQVTAQMPTQATLCTRITPYQGYLFDPQRYPFLEQHAVSDAHLSNALALLLWVHGEPVNYATLDVRLLGTLYAELLEYKLEVEPE